ncbi:MAG TPA: NADP-dependent oxidoreductase [Methylomirabilota bacterium]|nr:NADP-dependent oxidoreductase [Methylomirabilota bacterium]
MKAAQVTNYNEKIEVNNIEQPKIVEGKVLVEIHAAGINPFDWKVRAGYMKDFMPVQLPLTLGGDFSGTITAVGDDVTDFHIGDEVYGQANAVGGGSGSFAEFALASAKNIAAKPKNIDFLQAGAIPLTGVSALQALTEHINLQKDQKILIHGGAGGIGSIAIQIAKHIGAYVATTVSTNDKEYAQKLGADEVIDYQNQKFEDVVKDYDAVYDTVGTETYKRSFSVLKNSGIIVSMIEQPNEELMKQFGVTALVQLTKVTTQHLTKLTELLDNHVVTIHIEKTFSLDEAEEALTYVQQTPPQGKVVLVIKK